MYILEGDESVRYGKGIHTKHRHIKYHDFFINNIEDGVRVLDVGCGNGALANSIARSVNGVYIYGIDINEANIKAANEKFAGNNIYFVCGDALKDLPDERFDVIVLSNVLEHIEDRIGFLTNLKEKYKPSKFLIRVPLFERDWRVPLKEELGVDYRLDKTHYIEYREEEFFDEIEKLNLAVIKSEVKWGELWVELLNRNPE